MSTGASTTATAVTEPWAATCSPLPPSKQEITVMVSGGDPGSLASTQLHLHAASGRGQGQVGKQRPSWHRVLPHFEVLASPSIGRCGKFSWLNKKPASPFSPPRRLSPVLCCLAGPLSGSPPTKATVSTGFQPRPCSAPELNPFHTCFTPGCQGSVGWSLAQVVTRELVAEPGFGLGLVSFSLGPAGLPNGSGQVPSLSRLQLMTFLVR